MFKIDTTLPYPADYNETTKVVIDEKKKNVRPELTHTVENMDSYEVIYLGYPTGGEHSRWLFSPSWSHTIFQER